MRYLVLQLCDNDFAETLKQTLEHLEFHDHKKEPVSKLQVINLLAGFCLIRNYSWVDVYCPESVGKYFKNRLKVEYTDVAPSLDHDGGSAALDTCTGYVWNF